MRDLVADARVLFQAAVDAVQARTLFEQVDVEASFDRPLDAYRRIMVVGAGKAGMAAAGAWEAWCPRPVDGGVVVVPHGYRRTLPASQHGPERVEVVEAGHPVPDEAGMRAARRALELASSCGKEDLLVVLISGGGSSLWPLPAGDLTLEDVQETFRLLLRSGADIHEMNTVRKHLSRVKGGQLAVAARPASVVAFVISDVVGDDLSVIASGPTVPDPSTFDEAVQTLQQYGLWDDVPGRVRRHLEKGCEGELPETPGPEHEAFRRCRTLLIGSNRRALEAARSLAAALGYEARIVQEGITGEARDVGPRLAETALQVERGTPTCLLWGGETTVTVRGGGKGGRNQELALAAALALEGTDREIVLLSGGTDGVDGPTDAAGAWVTSQTVSQARNRGLDPEAHLNRNDSYSLFEAVGGLLKIGPTHTNVMDLQIALIGG